MVRRHYTASSGGTGSWIDRFNGIAGGAGASTAVSTAAIVSISTGIDIDGGGVGGVGAQHVD